jgi:hypothetical protein
MRGFYFIYDSWNILVLTSIVYIIDMANTLWTFGDSFTEGFGHWAKKYIEWKGYKPPNFSDILSKDLSFIKKNMGEGGSDNYTIFENICKNIWEIKENDFVIIGWSTPVRFRLTTKNDTWVSIRPGDDTNLSLFDHLSKQSIDEILLNRSSYKFAHEVDSWIRLINRALPKTDIIHWTPFGGAITKCEYIRLLTVSEESEGVVDDGHYGEVGHSELAEIFKSRYTKPIVKRSLI